MEWWNAGNPTFQSSDIPTFQYSNIPILRWLFVLAGIKFYDGLLVGVFFLGLAGSSFAVGVGYVSGCATAAGI